MNNTLISRDLDLTAPFEPNPEAEKLYTERLAASRAALDPEDREPESLADCIRFIENWLPEASPANNQGQVSFTRALCESALETMKAELARQTAEG